MMFANTKLQIQTLTKETDIVNWVAILALTYHKHPKYHHELTEYNAQGQVDFKSSLAPDQSSNLYILINNALGKMASHLIIDSRVPDGLLLLAQVQSLYSAKDTSLGNKMTLLAEFNAMIKTSSEDYSMYAIRFCKKIKELDVNEVQYDKSPPKH